MGTLAAMAMMVSPAFTKHARAEAGIVQVADTFRLARDTAISQRRNVRVVFVGLTAIQTIREDIGAGRDCYGNDDPAHRGAREPHAVQS